MPIYAAMLRLLRLRIGFQNLADELFRTLRLHSLVTSQQFIEVVIAFFGDLPAGRVDFRDNFIFFIIISHGSSLKFRWSPPYVSFLPAVLSHKPLSSDRPP